MSPLDVFPDHASRQLLELDVSVDRVVTEVLGMLGIAGQREIGMRRQEKLTVIQSRRLQ
jgi:hypothetical protein